MKISVVMATYNGTAFLGEQLSSLARQSRLPDELIISDDGSSDDTIAMVTAFAATAPFPVWVSQQRQRLNFAKNFVSAAEKATGDLIFFADQDDVWSDQKIAVIEETANASSETVFYHDIALISEEGETLCSSYYKRLQKNGFPPAVCFKGCALALKKSFVEFWGWPPTTTNITHDFWVALLATGFQQRCNSAHILLQHRLHRSNASGWVASPQDRTRAETVGAVRSDADLLIELCIKPWNLAWTDVFLKVIADNEAADQRQASELAACLRKNAAWQRHRAG